MHDVTYGRAPLISIARKNHEPERRGFLHLKYHGILKPTLIGLMVLGFIGGVSWWWMSQKIALPDQIAGMPRVTDPAVERQADRAAQMVRDQLDRPADAALYGDPAGTAMVVITVAGSSDGTAKDELAAAAADPSGQVALRLDESKSFEADGASFACAPVTGIALPTWCLFQDGEISGLVMTTHTRIRDARPLAVETYRALGA